jgi:ribosomal protein S18 acetylase RimI-like enzyme
MTVTLRGFRDGDGAGLLAVHVGAILAIPDAVYSAAERQSWAHGLTEDGYARARDAGETFIIATTADEIVGFCAWTPEHIRGLYVAPHHQGRGIGALLLGAGEAALREAGVALSRIHSSEAAVAFYQSHGYVMVGRSQHISRGGLPMADAMLEKLLA